VHRRRIVGLGVVATRAIGVFLSTAGGAPCAGTIDSTWGTNGKLIATFGSGDCAARAVLVDSQNRVIVGGYKTGTADDFAVERFDSTGTPDPAFGTAGQVTTDLGGVDRIHAMALQANGSIVAAGISGTNFGVARYTSGGALDPSFGNGGTVVTSIGNGDDLANAVAIQPDGKIVVVGYVNTSGGRNIAVVRYTAAGKLDTTFHKTGIVTRDIGGENDFATSVAIQSDGRILVAGGTGTSGQTFLVVRFNRTGGLDSNFGSGGISKISVPSSDSWANAIGLQTGGKIVVGGYAYNGSRITSALARVNANGSRDASFGSAGSVVTSFGQAIDVIHAMMILGDGSIVVAGAADGDVFVAHYTSSGAIDSSWGTGGSTTTDFGRLDQGLADAVTNDGKVVVAGFSGDQTHALHFAVARYIL
jgi:uncharacterized delta-60 repeat protein